MSSPLPLRAKLLILRRSDLRCDDRGRGSIGRSVALDPDLVR